MSKKRVAITTLGCKVNQCESSGIAEELTERGYEVVPFQAKADIYIINTCTVTMKTDYQSRQLIRRANRLNPSAMIIATGCYAQTAPQKLAGLPGVRMVVGSYEKEYLPEIIASKYTNGSRIISEQAPQSVFHYSSGSSPLSHTRAFLKVQDGCDALCSYCIVPFARGKSRSVPVGEVLSRFKALACAGYKEVVLTGIHLGMYGLDLNPPLDLLGLLKIVGENRFKEGMQGFNRLRLSSIEPLEIKDDLIDFVRTSDFICRHFHIPLQSGSDKVLASMNRCYTGLQFKALVEKIVDCMPDASIGTDVMAGFPGEEESDFLSTLDLIAKMPIAYLHVFPYSKRPGTAASLFPGQVDDNIKKERAARLRSLGKEKCGHFNQNHLGKVLSVLIEKPRDKVSGLWKGLSNNYIPVLVDGAEDRILSNRLVDVAIDRVENEKLVGRIQDYGK